MTSRATPEPSSVLAAAVIDTVLVIVFVAVGRASHAEDLAGMLATAWPFLAGLALGWLVMRAWRSPRRIVWTGIGLWVGTVAGGMALRALSGQGVQPSFVIVTVLVLAAFLLGWRAIAALIAVLIARARAAR